MTATERGDLPNFTDHGSHSKNAPLTEEDVQGRKVQAIELEVLKRAAVSGRKLRVLDFGCGKGAFVARLRQMGHDAYGVDVADSYIRSASAYFGSADAPLPAVSKIQNGRSVFPDDFFDVVFSDQVFEHVPNLTGAVEEISRVLRPGGVSLHILPSRFCLVEPHMFLPLVHWLPKGRGQKMAISALMRLGLGARFFKDQSFADRVEIFEKFSRTETFYRPLSEYQREFGRVDMSVENVVGLKIKLRYSENSILSKLEISGKISQLYSVFHQIYFTAVKIAA